MSAPPPAGVAGLTAALVAGLWQQARPRLLARVQAMEAVAEAARRGEQPAAGPAAGEAHRLAGALGTYGLARGSILAREAEDLLLAAPGVDAPTGARLRELCSALRAELEG